MKTRTKQALKRARLIKEMFYTMLFEYGIDKNIIPIQFRINHSRKHNHGISLMRFFYDVWGLTRQKIYFNFCDLNDRTKNGFDDDYYEGRREKLNFVLHNRKLCLRFVLLHEIKHAIDCRNIEIEKFKNWEEETCEQSADDFAIKKLGIKND